MALSRVGLGNLNPTLEKEFPCARGCNWRKAECTESKVRIQIKLLTLHIPGSKRAAIAGSVPSRYSTHSPPDSSTVHCIVVSNSLHHLSTAHR
eukprot:801448-Pelagomonas_calceolata.AAC.1